MSSISGADKAKIGISVVVIVLALGFVAYTAGLFEGNSKGDKPPSDTDVAAEKEMVDTLPPPPPGAIEGRP